MKLTACSASPVHTRRAASTDPATMRALDSWIPAKAGTSSVPMPQVPSAAEGSAEIVLTAST